MLGATLMRWFPLSTWSGIPFLGDWPARFQVTVDGVHHLRHAALAGWRWEFLGGYPLANDAGQALTLWAALPIAVLGGPAGFHLTQVLLALVIPALAWWRARVTGGAGRDAAWLAAGVAAIFCAGYASPLVRAGDTHVLAGAVAAFAAWTAARALRAGDEGLVPAVALVASLTVAGLGPPAFFLYTLLLLAIDAAVARDGRSLRRALVAAGAAAIAGLPATWDLWRYPSAFLASRPAWHPGGDAAVLVPMLAAPLLASLMVRRGRFGAVACGVTLAVAIGLAARMSFAPVPHVSSARGADTALVDRMARLDGDLVAVEDAFTRRRAVCRAAARGQPASASIPGCGAPEARRSRRPAPDLIARCSGGGCGTSWRGVSPASASWTPAPFSNCWRPADAGSTMSTSGRRSIPVPDDWSAIRRWAVSFA